MTTTINEKTYEYRGLSTDVKPLEEAGNGSIFIEIDTGKVYIFDEENLIWIELSTKYGDSDTGSSGGSDSGANITSNIKIVDNKSSILSSNHNKLCILNDTSELSFKISNEYLGGVSATVSLGANDSRFRKDRACSYYCDDNNKIYIFHSNATSGNDYHYSGINVTVYDCSTNTYVIQNQVLSSSTTYGIGSSSVVYKDGYFYLLAENFTYNRDGSVVDWRIFKIDRETLALTLIYSDNTWTGAYQRHATAQIIDNKIYICGGLLYDAGTKDYPYIRIFNIDTNTFENKINFLSFSKGYSFLMGTYIFLIGGKTFVTSSSFTNKKSIYRFNTIDNTYETIIEEIPNIENFIYAFRYGNFIYFFDSPTNAYKFDMNTFEITAVDLELPFTLSETLLITNTNGFKTYFNNYTGSSNTYFYELNITFELQQNTCYIYSSNGTGYNFNLLENVTIPIKNVYIGDSNNTAQLANAYLYDETQSAWVNINTGEVLS